MTMTSSLFYRAAILSGSLLLLTTTCVSQITPSPLDPVRTVTLSEPPQPSLPEQYIWTASDVTARRPDRSKFSWSHTDLQVRPQIFRAHFHVDRLPSSATLYLAGPRWAKAYLNGKRLGTFSTNTDQPINFRVFHADAEPALHVGDNVLAIEAVRGRGVPSSSLPENAQQLAYGEVLVAKVLAGPFGDDQARALVISDGTWKSHPGPVEQSWQNDSFNDSAWPAVESIGPVESDINFRQWSADAGMYGWPGYTGMSSFLRSFTLPAAEVTHVYKGDGSFESLSALTGEHSGNFTVSLNRADPSDAEAPSLLLDFGREIAGRILLESASSQDTLVSAAYGESEIEALATGIAPTPRGGNFLGTNLIDVPANGVARGPKSAFRYVRLRFLRGAPTTAFRAIRVEGITYPVRYEGSFESSDKQLNRIWETAAYTAHLCMQDDIWDAPKRDRGRWAGDLNVEADTILSAFGDTFLLEDTLRRLAEAAPAGHHVNGIPGYTAQWIATLAELYQHTDDRTFLVSQHDALLRLLQTMDSNLDPATGLLKSSAQGWWYVDWAPNLYGDTPDSRMGTTLEYLRAYQAAPVLFRAMGDEANAKRYQEQADRLREAAQKAYLPSGATSVGTTWQDNAMAVLTDLDPASNSAIWSSVLSHVKQDAPADQVISTYFNAYVLNAMARAGHDREALDWIRAYWGGMLDEGATSFWEAYDLRWPKENFHLSLSADGTNGYFVSLAHGWSSGPASWLQENVLGVRPLSPGYATVEIHPHLLDLQFAHGSVATPHGPLKVSIDAKKGLSLDIPPGIESARVYVPTKTGTEAAKPVVLSHSGHFDFALR